MPITATETTSAIRRPALSAAAAAFLAKKHQMLIDGKWVDARSGQTFTVEDPATEEIIAQVPAGDKADIDLAVAAARRAFETGPWSRISPAARQRLIWSLGDLLERHADELAELEALDNGKPVTHARRDDVGGSIEMFRNLENSINEPLFWNGAAVVELMREEHLESPTSPAHRWSSL